MASTRLNSPNSVFIDASVRFAASRSPRGFARDLIEAGIRGRVALVLSPFVVQETRRNLSSKAPEALPLFEVFLAPGFIRMVQPSPELVERVAAIIVLKDAPIVAGAIEAGVELVATYDRRHLLSKREEILAHFGVTVATPGEILPSL
jgi:predicted nucleic acid-binding protein